MRLLKANFACGVANIEPHYVNNYAGKGLADWLPASDGNGQSRLFSAELDAPLLCLFADLLKIMTVANASLIVERVKAAALAYPEADRLVSVYLDNGSVFTLPTDALDLASGWTSGGFVTWATAFDLRNYRERVRRAIEAAPMVIGDD